MRYQYWAVDANSKKVNGFVNANDKNSVMEQLAGDGLIALNIQEEDEGAQLKTGWDREIGQADIHKMKISAKRLLPILNQMALMMKAGVTLSMAMDVLIESQRDKNMKQILQEMNQDLYGGIPISASMAKFRAFPELVISMVHSGEENGHLDTAFEQCASIIEKETAVVSKIRSAMAYPTFVLCLTIGLVFLMNLVVLPSFAGVFSQFHANLPTITLMVMGFSNFLRNYWYLIVLLIIVLIVFFKLAPNESPALAYKLDRMKVRFPIIGEVLRESFMCRFSRVLSSLIKAGVNVVQSLEISRDIITNRYLKDQLDQIIGDVKVGVSINAAMSRFPIFDSLMVSMVKVGEESGMISDSMEKMASLYEQRTDANIKKLTGMLEPAMIIIVALIVGTVMISIVIPMFGIYSIIK